MVAVARWAPLLLASVRRFHWAHCGVPSQAFRECPLSDASQKPRKAIDPALILTCPWVLLPGEPWTIGSCCLPACSLRDRSFAPLARCASVARWETGQRIQDSRLTSQGHTCTWLRCGPSEAIARVPLNDCSQALQCASPTFRDHVSSNEHVHCPEAGIVAQALRNEVLRVIREDVRPLPNDRCRTTAGRCTASVE
jgi:hypothetical protein